MDASYSLPQTEIDTRSFITKVYGWMSLGLALSGWISAMIYRNDALLAYVISNQILFFGLIIAELGLVVALSGWVHKMTAAAATLAFVTFAAFNGVTLSVVFAAYTAESIGSTFFLTAGTFGIMSLYGYTTKTDLTSMGNFLFMALLGLILASVVNIFLRSPMVYWITTYAGILIFVGLTAYDTQKIKRMSQTLDASTEEGHKMAIMGALRLYLDFINLFLLLLRVMGRRR